MQQDALLDGLAPPSDCVMPGLIRNQAAAGLCFTRHRAWGLGLCFAWLYKQDRAVADDWVLRLRYAAHRPSRGGGREGGREGVVTQDCFQLDSHRVSCGHMR